MVSDYARVCPSCGRDLASMPEEISFCPFCQSPLTKDRDDEAGAEEEMTGEDAAGEEKDSPKKAKKTRHERMAEKRALAESATPEELAFHSVNKDGYYDEMKPEDDASMAASPALVAAVIICSLLLLVIITLFGLYLMR